MQYSFTKYFLILLHRNFPVNAGGLGKMQVDAQQVGVGLPDGVQRVGFVNFAVAGLPGIAVSQVQINSVRVEAHRFWVQQYNAFLFDF